MLHFDLESTTFRTIGKNFNPANITQYLWIVNDLERIRNSAIPEDGLIVTTTYTPLYNLKDDAGLTPGITYFMSDIGVYLVATAADALSGYGIFKAELPDWQNTTGNFLGVWTSTLAGVAANKLCSWNNVQYKNKTGFNGVSDPSIDTTNWEVDTASVQIEYDPVVYDFENNVFNARWDRRGNSVLTWTGYAINKFQWGRDAVFSCLINSSYADVENYNAINASSNLKVFHSELIIRDTATALSAFIEAGSSIILTGTVNCNYLKAVESNVTMSAGAMVDTTLDRYATITCSASGVNCGLGYYRNCSLTFTGTSQVIGCKIDGGDALNGPFTKTFSSENHRNRMFIRETFNNFVYPSNVTVTSVTTTLALPGSGFYSEFVLDCTGGVPSINTITGIATNLTAKLRLTTTNNCTFVHGATLKLKGAANKTLNKNNEDWIEIGLGGGAINKEINSGIY